MTNSHKSQSEKLQRPARAGLRGLCAACSPGANPPLSGGAPGQGAPQRPPGSSGSVRGVRYAHFRPRRACLGRGGRAHARGRRRPRAPPAASCVRGRAARAPCRRRGPPRRRLATRSGGSLRAPRRGLAFVHISSRTKRARARWSAALSHALNCCCPGARTFPLARGAAADDRARLDDTERLK